MARHATIIGQIRDCNGFQWDVREIRPSSHDFSLYFGWPHGQRGKGYGGPRLIPTRELRAYWRYHSLDRNGAIFDLPAAPTTLKRVRRIFGFDSYGAHHKWWLERIDDLCNLSGAHFARKYDVHESDVSVVAKSFFGPKIRPTRWYLEPETFLLLTGSSPHAFVAMELGITLGASRRLRSNLRRAPSSVKGASSVVAGAGT